MAKKQITSASTPLEIRTAQEQLTQAQQEFNVLYRTKFNNQEFSAIEISKVAEQIAAKYDYVDFGQLASTIGDQFFVQGLNNQTNSVYNPSAKTIVNADDSFPVTKNTTVVTPLYNKQGTSPYTPKTDQSIANEAAPQPAIQSPQVQPTTESNQIGSKDANQVGAALESTARANNKDTQNGIINQNPNNFTNNTAGQLLDQPSSFKKTSNSDDAMPASRLNDNVVAQTNSQDPARPSSTGTATPATTSSIPIPESTPGTSNKPGITERPNILHEYANWTYKIAWYMLSPDGYNTMMESGNPPTDKTLIARTGGAGSELDVAMAGDVYFRNLRFTSVIGNRQTGAATNNFELEMTVVEPYGASLIGELAAMALNRTGKGSISPAEVPYLLEIDFAGYKDDGSMVQSILSSKKGKKYIPIRIIDISMKLEAAGSVYTISMVPFSFFAQTPRYAEMEIGPVLEGKTVGEMLGDQGRGLMALINGNEQYKHDKGMIEFPDKYAIEFYCFNEQGNKTDELENSKFAYPNSGSESTRMKLRPSNNNPAAANYPITKGSLIKDVIKNIVLYSQYYAEKVDPKKPSGNNKPAELIKVIPVVEFTKDFDTARNEYAKKITFKVFNTLLWGELFPGVGSPEVESWGYSKTYNWLFTGKNADIIDADLTFRYIYFATMQTNVSDYGQIKNQQVADDMRSLVDVASKSKIAPAFKGGAVSNTGSNMSQRYINSVVAAEWFDSKMMSSTGDNITVDLRIIGDPDWIPQDASVRGGDITVATELYDKYDSVAVDVAGVYVKLNLRTPRDYNDKTGLMDLKADQTTVQGVYQVITVESNFEDGKFTQLLNMVKMPASKEESPGSKRQTENQRLGRGGAIPNGPDPALSNINQSNGVNITSTGNNAGQAGR